MNKRYIRIANVLLAESEFSKVNQAGYSEEEGGYLYSVKSQNGGEKTILVKPGGTIKVKKGDEFVTIDMHVPYDITVLHDSNIKDFHAGIKGWLGDSSAVREDVYQA
jgi:hypothetical protein